MKQTNMNESIIELITGEMEQPTNSMIKTQKQEVKLHTVFFDEPIGAPKKYRDLISQLFQAEANDQFIFMMNTPGGYLTTALAIIEAIKNTEATVRAVLIGECHSAGSIIALNCHNIVVTDSAHALIHTAQYGTEGQTGNVKAHVDFSTKHIQALIEDTYSGFMTPTEIADLNKGLEFWFDAKQLNKRLLDRMKYQEAKAAKKVRTKTKTVAAATEE